MEKINESSNLRENEIISNLKKDTYLQSNEINTLKSEVELLKNKYKIANTTVEAMMQEKETLHEQYIKQKEDVDIGVKENMEEVSKIRIAYKNALIEFMEKQNEKLLTVSPKISLQNHKVIQNELFELKEKITEKILIITNLNKIISKHELEITDLKDRNKESDSYILDIQKLGLKNQNLETNIGVLNSEIKMRESEINDLKKQVQNTIEIFNKSLKEKEEFNKVYLKLQTEYDLLKTNQQMKSK